MTTGKNVIVLLIGYWDSIRTKNRSISENAVTGIWGTCTLLVMGSCPHSCRNKYHPCHGNSSIIVRIVWEGSYQKNNSSSLSRAIILYEPVILLGSNHLLCYKKNDITNMKMRQNKLLPGQWWLLHSRDCTFSPKQNNSPLGWIQTRFLNWIPDPHVRVHWFQSLQLVQFPVANHVIEQKQSNKNTISVWAK